MSDTPRTDEAEITDCGGADYCLSKFVRQLERELTAAKAALSGRTVSCSNCNALASENAALRELVKRARDMIDVAPDSPPNEWPSTEQINQLVKDCDTLLK